MRAVFATIFVVLTIALAPANAEQPSFIQATELRQYITFDGFTPDQEKTVIDACQIAVWGIPELIKAIKDPAVKIIISHSDDLEKMARQNSAGTVPNDKAYDEIMSLSQLKPTALTVGAIEAKRVVYRIYIRNDMLAKSNTLLEIDLLVHELDHVSYKNERVSGKRQGKIYPPHSIAEEEVAVYTVANDVFKRFFQMVDPILKKGSDYDSTRLKLAALYNENDQLLSKWQAIAKRVSSSSTAQ